MRPFAIDDDIIISVPSFLSTASIESIIVVSYDASTLLGFFETFTNTRKKSYVINPLSIDVCYNYGSMIQVAFLMKRSSSTADGGAASPLWSPQSPPYTISK